jgi:transcriptional regulator with XRE-family HTH domain
VVILNNQEFANREVGMFIEEKMSERELHLVKKGKLERGKRISARYMANELGVSNTLFSRVLKGNQTPSDEMLLKIADFLEIDEHELFRRARKLHPSIAEEAKKEYLGNYYLPTK